MQGWFRWLGSALVALLVVTCMLFVPVSPAYADRDGRDDSSSVSDDDDDDRDDDDDDRDEDDSDDRDDDDDSDDLDDDDSDDLDDDDSDDLDDDDSDDLDDDDSDDLDENLAEAQEKLAEAQEKLAEADARMAEAQEEAAANPEKAESILAKAQEKVAELQSKAATLVLEAEGNAIEHHIALEALAAGNDSSTSSVLGRYFAKGLKELAGAVLPGAPGENASLSLSVSDLAALLDDHAVYSETLNTVLINLHDVIISFSAGQGVLLNGAEVSPEVLAQLPGDLSAQASFLREILLATVTLDPDAGLMLTLPVTAPEPAPSAGEVGL